MASTDGNDMLYRYSNVQDDAVRQILNGTDLQIDLNAHWVKYTQFVPPLPGLTGGPYLHTWIDISSDVAGVRKTITLSWEPENPNADLFNGSTPLVTILDSDNQSDPNNIKTGGGSALVAPYPLTFSPSSSLSSWYGLKNPVASNLTLAMLLINKYYQFKNYAAPGYYAQAGYFDPKADQSQNVYNSNSGTYTLLRAAGFSQAQLDSIHLETSQNTYASLSGQGSVCPGWDEKINDKYFNSDTLFEFFKDGALTSPATGLVAASYLKNLILANPVLADAFHGSLGALGEIANGIEAIDNGGVLNIATGGMDLFLAATKLFNIAPPYNVNPPIIFNIPGVDESIIKNPTFAQWVQTYGLSALADLQGLVNGFKQGGVAGGVEAGYSADELVQALDHIIGITLRGGGLTPGEFETAIIVGVIVGLATLFLGGNHDNPADMPDKYDTARYTEFVGELQGSAATAYGPAYNAAADPVQGGLGGLPEILYIQDWIKNNIDSTNSEVQREAEKLLPLYGTTGDGKLSFAHDIADEQVIGGSESGTYVSIYQDAGQAIGEIKVLNTALPDKVVLPPSAQPPAVDYGGLPWVPFFLPDGNTGYWAPKGDGTFYYFGPNPVLYDDKYPGEVQPQDVAINAVGYAPTYDFTSAMNSQTSGTYYDGGSYSGDGIYYGGVYLG